MRRGYFLDHCICKSTLRGRIAESAYLSLAKTLSDEAGQGRRVFRAGVIRSSNGEPSGEGAERMFASRIESTRSTPPVEPEYSIRGWQQS